MVSPPFVVFGARMASVASIEALLQCATDARGCRMKALAVVLVVLCVVLAACGAGNDESDIDGLEARVAELELRLDHLLR